MSRAVVLMHHQLGQPASPHSGGNNQATTRFPNAFLSRAVFHPCRPRVHQRIEATTILTRGGLVKVLAHVSDRCVT